LSDDIARGRLLDLQLPLSRSPRGSLC